MLNSSTATLGGTTRRALETYADLYADRGDSLEGDYAPLFAKFGTASTLTLTQLRSQIVDADDAVPLVFLVLVDDEGRSPAIRALHRATRKPPELVPTPNDGKTFCFVGDVLLGRSIDMALLPRDIFEDFPDIPVLSIQATDAAIAALPAGSWDLPAPEVGEAIEQVSVRAAVPVPFTLLPVVLNADHTPRSLWTAALPIIRGSTHPDQFQPFLDWIRVALTRSDDDGSAVSLGWERDALVQTSGRALQALKQRTLLRDFPWWNPDLQREDRLELVVETIQRQANQARAIERAERDASKAPKLPSEKFQFAHRKWLLVAGVSEEQDLPGIYHDLANAAKGELRLCLQDHLDARAQEEDAASATKVLATVACFEAIKAGNFGRLVSLDDLSAGIQPFACGFDAAPAHASVAATIAAFDMMAASQVQASLPEHRELAAKTAHFPRDGLEFQQMLGTTSLFLDVLQGNQHPHAKAFRRFVRVDIPILQAALRSWDAATAQYYGNFYPTIMRAIQIAMISYWADLTDGLDPELPDYKNIRQLVVTRSMHLFTPVPRSYLVLPSPVLHQERCILGIW
jgi:hypothetical protein